MKERIQIRLRPGLPRKYLPRARTAGASGVDLLAAIPRPICIPGGSWKVIPTGLFLALPLGIEGQVRSRSGLSSCDGIFVLNGVGTIDSDYRGEIGVVLANFAPEDYAVLPGQRVAQLVFSYVPRVELVEVKRLPRSMRGAKGFGSTGCR